MSKKLLAFLPFGIFIGIIAMFAFGMWGNRVSKDASPLIGKPMPIIRTITIDNKPLEIKGNSEKPLIINFFASWCAPCKAENANLLRLAQNQDIAIIGIAYRDKPNETMEFLNSLGNPFFVIGTDIEGKIGTDFGLTGVPETYIINKEGIIIYKHKGEVLDADIAKITKIAIDGKINN